VLQPTGEKADHSLGGGEALALPDGEAAGVLVRRTVRADELRPGYLIRNPWHEFVRVTAVHASGGSLWIATADRDVFERLDPDAEIDVVVDQRVQAGS
jgi:hypothetical protein